MPGWMIIATFIYIKISQNKWLKQSYTPNKTKEKKIDKQIFDSHFAVNKKNRDNLEAIL